MEFFFWLQVLITGILTALIPVFARLIECGKWWATLPGAAIGFAGAIGTGVLIQQLGGPGEMVFLSCGPGPFLLALLGASLAARFFPKRT